MCVCVCVFVFVGSLSVWCVYLRARGLMLVCEGVSEEWTLRGNATHIVAFFKVSWRILGRLGDVLRWSWSVCELSGGGLGAS